MIDDIINPKEYSPVSNCYFLGTVLASVAGSVAGKVIGGIFGGDEEGGVTGRSSSTAGPKPEDFDSKLTLPTSDPFKYRDIGGSSSSSAKQRASGSSAIEFGKPSDESVFWDRMLRQAKQDSMIKEQ